MAYTSDILALALEGDLDVTSVAHVRARIDEALDGGCKRVIINFAESDYIDSLGVALLLSVARRLNQAGGLLSLTNVGESVYRTLTICRLIDFIPVSSNAPKPPIPALDPSIRPLWHSTMQVDPSCLSEVRQRMSEIFERTDLTPEEIFDLTLAGGEALGNAIDHTCADGVLCSLEVYFDRVVVEVSDCGDGFALAREEVPTISEDEDELERGRGIKLMRMLADSVEINRKPSGEGTVVRLVKLYTPMEISPR